MCFVVRRESERRFWRQSKDHHTVHTPRPSKFYTNAERNQHETHVHIDRVIFAVPLHFYHMDFAVWICVSRWSWVANERKNVRRSKNVTSYSKEGPLSLFLQIKQNTLSLDDMSQCATMFHSRITIFGPSSFDVISRIFFGYRFSVENQKIRNKKQCNKQSLKLRSYSYSYS